MTWLNDKFSKTMMKMRWKLAKVRASLVGTDVAAGIGVGDRGALVCAGAVAAFRAGVCVGVDAGCCDATEVAMPVG